MEQQQLQQRKKRSLRSEFSGTAGKYFFLRLGLSLLAIIPIIGLPNAVCILERYHCKHTQKIMSRKDITLKHLVLGGKELESSSFNHI